jgi:hypothetical protein
MTLVAEHSCLAFDSPRTLDEHALRCGAGTVARAAKEPLGDEMMTSCMTASFHRGTSIRPRGSMKEAIADGAVLGHFW